MMMFVFLPGSRFEIQNPDLQNTNLPNLQNSNCSYVLPNVLFVHLVWNRIPLGGKQMIHSKLAVLDQAENHKWACKFGIPVASETAFKTSLVTSFT